MKINYVLNACAKIAVQQINHHFTLPLKEKLELVERSLLITVYSDIPKRKVIVERYMNSLVGYLDEHYQLSINLAIAIKEYEFYSGKRSSQNITLLVFLLSSVLLCGVLLPLWFNEFKSGKKVWYFLVWVFPALCFIAGSVFLFLKSIYLF